MIFYTQQITEGEKGDCLRTCLASILDIHPAKIPNFALHGEEWYENFNTFLAKHSLIATKKVGMMFEGVYILVAVMKHGGHHALICRDGKIIHDPDPNKTPMDYPVYSILFNYV